MIGARGLGNEVLIAVNRTEIGRGLVSGLSVVALAILMDRADPGLVRRKEEGEGAGGRPEWLSGASPSSS